MIRAPSFSTHTTSFAQFCQVVSGPFIRTVYTSWPLTKNLYGPAPCLDINLTAYHHSGRVAARWPECGKRSDRKGASLPAEGGYAAKRYVWAKAACWQATGRWVTPIVCREGIHYWLLRVRGRRRVNDTSSGRWIPQLPAAKHRQDFLLLEHPALRLAFVVASTPFPSRSHSKAAGFYAWNVQHLDILPKT
jgi:hypothetical protein